MKNCIRLFGMFVLFLVGAVQAQDSVDIRQKTRLASPSNWLQQTENAILLFESRLLSNTDTSFMLARYPRLLKDLELNLNDLRDHGPVMRIRALEDLKSKFLQQKKDLDRWRNQVRRQNDVLATHFLEINEMMADSAADIFRGDSSLSRIYNVEMSNVRRNLANVEIQYQQQLEKTVAIENTLNSTHYVLGRAVVSVDRELDKRSKAMFQKVHPSFWELNVNSYPKGIGEVFMETVRQNIQSLTFYAKNAYIRVILFRVLLLVITLLPIWYFRKNRKKMAETEPQDPTVQPYRFVHKYTGASTSSFVLVMAPFIFINAPHLFTEAILVTIAITTSLIFLKENKEIGKTSFYLFLGLYVILKAMNLMVTVTYFGRVIWLCSILGLIPLVKIYRDLGKSKLKSSWLFRLIIILSGILYFIGWCLNITGHFPLGRILLLTALDQFFLAIVLYVAVFSFIDFIAILANIYNNTERITKIRVDLIYKKLLFIVRFLSVGFWFYSFLLNINALHFVRENIFSVFSQQVNFGDVSFTPGSVMIYFLVLYLSFYLSGLLDGLFIDEKRMSSDAGKTSLGSIVLLLRLFILSTGFIGGLVIAGIPLNNLNLFVGALGVGIGFGLQPIIANLFSGVIIAFEKPIFVGDIVELDGGARGRVTNIGLRATKVDTADGAEYVIPNGDLVGKVLKNWTLTNRNFKIETTLDVDHSNDLNAVIHMIQRSIREMSFVLSSPNPHVDVQSILPNGVRIYVSCWINNIVDSVKAKGELLASIHQKFDEAGVVYPKKKAED